MRETLKYRSAGLAMTTVMGVAALAGCSSHSAEKSSEATKTSIATTPPVAKPGEAFSCNVVSDPSSLAESPANGASQALSELFHKAPEYIESEARYGLATCERSITAKIADSMGFVVMVNNIDPNYSCITWTAIYGSRQQADEGKPTNHIGLVCIPESTTTSQASA